MNKRTCPCRKWELTGIPCCHAISSILEVNQDPLHYVHDCYSKDIYMQAYNQMMCPMNSQKFWAKTGHDPHQPPPLKTKPGRKARNRRKEIGEVGASGHKLSKNGRIMTCSLCFKTGHNKKGCPTVKEQSSRGVNITKNHSTCGKVFCRKRAKQPIKVSTTREGQSQGSVRLGDEPEPSFMTNRTQGFKKWGKQFITTRQLETQVNKRRKFSPPRSPQCD